MFPHSPVIGGRDRNMKLHSSNMAGSRDLTRGSVGSNPKSLLSS